MSTKPRPLVTVVVPSFNHARFVEQCVRSIVTQDYENFELVVVDDGSSDESPSILERLSAELGFRLILQANAGVPRTLNRGVAEGTGEYLAVCASDDFWLPGKLTAQVDYLEQHPEIAGCSGNVTHVDEHGVPLPGQKLVRAARYSFQDFLLSRYYFPAPAMMLRRAAFDLVGGFDPRFRMEDWPMWLRLSRAGYSLDVIEQSLVAYRVHGRNLHRQSALMVRDRLDILNEYSDAPWFDEAVHELAVRALFELSTHEKRAALKYLLPAFRSGALDWRVWVGVARLPLAPTVGEVVGRAAEQLVRRSASTRRRLAKWVGRVR